MAPSLPPSCTSQKPSFLGDALTKCLKPYMCLLLISKNSLLKPLLPRAWCAENLIHGDGPSRYLSSSLRRAPASSHVCGPHTFSRPWNIEGGTPVRRGSWWMPEASWVQCGVTSCFYRLASGIAADASSLEKALSYQTRTSFTGCPRRRRDGPPRHARCVPWASLRPRDLQGLEPAQA